MNFLKLIIAKNNMTNQPIEEKWNWREEFDSLYEDVLNFAICCEGSSLDCACNRQTVLTNVKGFIENLLEQERKRMSEEIESIKRPQRSADPDPYCDEYNQALDDAKAIINQ